MASPAHRPPQHSSTVDDMLEWMRERKRATKRFQNACHEQYVHRSPAVALLSPRGDEEKRRQSGGPSMLRSDTSPPSSGVSPRTQSNQPLNDSEVHASERATATYLPSLPFTGRGSEREESLRAGSVEILHDEMVSSLRFPAGSASPSNRRDGAGSVASGGGTPRALGSSPRGSPRGASSVRMRDLENDELWSRIKELRDVIAARDQTVASKDDAIRLLQRRERELAATLVQSSLRHADSLHKMRCQDGEIASHEEAGGCLHDDTWWKRKIFTDEEQSTLDEIRRRHRDDI